MATEIEEKIIKIKHAWTNFITGEPIDETAINPFALSAWERCKNSGMDPYQTGHAEAVSPEQYRKCLIDNRDLTAAAAPTINKLYTQIPFADVISFFDRESLVLGTYGNAAAITTYRKDTNLGLGTYWSEPHIGSNAVEEAIREDLCITFIGAEHYLQCFHDTICIAVPIHDQKNTVIGCLGVAFETSAISTMKELKYLQDCTVMAAYAIDRQVALLRISEINQNIFESMEEGVIITDIDFAPSFINNKAQAILNISMPVPSGFCLTDNLQNASQLLESASNGETFSGELIFKFPGKTIDCRGSSTPLRFRNKIDGYLFVFAESQKYKRRINKIVGNSATFQFPDIVTHNPRMLDMISNAKRIADTNCNVLILGESGTGKELMAQSIHNASSRRDGPLVIVNCAALPRDLVESELFGYERGAFTGASKDGQLGKFELADKGTLFLDEIGEMPLEIQPKLLRAIETRSITRIGGSSEKKVDVRLICATNRNLQEEILQNRFRSDLFYRINVVTLMIPSLNERIDDVPLLAGYFINKLNAANSTKKKLSASYLKQLQEIHWNGNIRQLENAITQSYYMSEPGLDTISQVPDYLLQTKAYDNTQESMSLQNMEKLSIINALRKYGGNASKAALELGIGRTTLYRKLEQYKIDRSEFTT